MINRTGEITISKISKSLSWQAIKLPEQLLCTHFWQFIFNKTMIICGFVYYLLILKNFVLK